MRNKILFILKILIAIGFFLTFLLESIIDGKVVSLVTVTNVLMGMILSVIMIISLKREDKPKKWMIFNALLFAIFIEIGISMENTGSLSYFNNYFNLIRGLFNLVGLTVFISFLLVYTKKIFRKIKNIIINNKVLDFIFHQHLFGSAFVITLGVSLFYLIFYYPGTTCYDGIIQLSYYYNNLPFSNHHPALLTMAMGFLMDIGKLLGSDNLGLFFFVFLQIIINALVYAYVLLIMKKMNIPIVIRIGALVFYAFMPMLATNAITFYKDTLFYLVFLFMIVYTYYHFVFKYDASDNIKYVVLALLYLSLYLLRNTGYYIVLVTTLGYMLYFIKKDKKVMSIFFILFALTVGENVLYNKMLDNFNIARISPREALSIPLQESARYIKYNKNKLSLQEVEVLKNLFGDLDVVGGAYNPFISDDVKLLFKKYPSNEELKSYFKVWFKGLKKSPLDYIDATILNTYGYIYPNFINFTTGEETPGFYFIYNMEGSRVSLSHNKLNRGRDALYKFGDTLTKVPGLNMLYMPAFYVWIFISFGIYMVAFKRKNELIHFIPLFMVIIFAFLGPVNGHIRYVYPVMVSIPFVIAILFRNRIN